MVEPSKIKKIYQKAAAKNDKFRIYLKNNADSDELDSHFRRIHTELFSGYDCCKCHNCCSLYDIRLDNNDIAAISEELELNENDFIEQYLIASDDEYMMKEKPCCFLEDDGKCRIQEIKPAVCREFPHTDKPYRLYNMPGVFTFAEECPVVFEIIERLKLIYDYNIK
jgi:Fe-S-cluster containining protein